MTLHAVMDGSQYALAAQSGAKSLAATLGRPNEEGQRSSQVQLRLGQVRNDEISLISRCEGQDTRLNLQFLVSGGGDQSVSKMIHKSMTYI